MTQLLYLQDTYEFEDSVNALEISENEFGTYIILDRTIFYPQGGGQPSDTGTIKDTDGNIFEVQKCMLSPEGIVFHYGIFITGKISINSEVELNIEEENRIINARNHSAGHLVDVAMNILGYDSSLTAGKGFHFAEGSYVEYSGDLPEDIETMKNKLSSTFKELSEKNIPIIVKYEGLGDLEAPTGKSPRWVEFEGYFGCGCGGTHVKNSSEIGRVNIRKMKYKKGVLRVSYELN